MAFKTFKDIKNPVITVLSFNPQAWGDGALIMPHGLGIDPDGNVWVTDAGRHQAIKFSPEGAELAAIGLRAKPGHDLTHLCKPSAVRGCTESCSRGLPRLQP